MAPAIACAHEAHDLVLPQPNDSLEDEARAYVIDLLTRALDSLDGGTPSA